MNTRKLLGLALWLCAFSLPFWWSMLNTDAVVYEDGTANNMKGLLGFVLMIILLFAGYFLVDTAKGHAGPAHGDHGAHH